MDILDLVDALLADLADMHQAVDVVLESDERTKARELGDLAGDQVADLVVVVNGFPRILGQLLDAGGDALVFAIEGGVRVARAKLGTLRRTISN